MWEGGVTKGAKKERNAVGLRCDSGCVSKGRVRWTKTRTNNWPRRKEVNTWWTRKGWRARGERGGVGRCSGARVCVWACACVLDWQRSSGTSGKERESNSGTSKAARRSACLSHSSHHTSKAVRVARHIASVAPWVWRRPSFSAHQPTLWALTRAVSQSRAQKVTKIGRSEKIGQPSQRWEDSQQSMHKTAAGDLSIGSAESRTADS